MRRDRKDDGLDGVNKKVLVVSVVVIAALLFSVTRDVSFLSLTIGSQVLLLLQIVWKDPLLLFPSPYFWVDLSHRMFNATLVYASLITNEESLSLLSAFVFFLTVFSRLLLGKCMFLPGAAPKPNPFYDIAFLLVAAWSVLRFRLGKRATSILSPLFQVGSILIATAYDSF